MSRGACVLIVLTLLNGARSAAEQSVGRFGGVEAPRGARASGWLAVPAGVDEGTRIPLTVIHGARQGPILALIAGIHGAEYSPILALQTFSDRIDPARLSGTAVLVHMASPPAFFGRSVYVNPVDGKNVNRSFPGRREGTHSERIAYALTEQVIRPADVVIDVHSGDANESLTPWVGYYARHGEPAAIARSRELAFAFGAPYVVEFPGGPYKAGEAIYTGATAATLGKPTFDVEIGERGAIDLGNARRIQDGLLRVMRALRMVDDAPPADGTPVVVTRRSSVTAADDGVFYPEVSAGTRVTRGQRLGRTTDVFGGREEVHLAPVNGVVLVILSAPPVRAGETLAVIAEVP